MEVVVGRIGRPHGLRGEVTVQVSTDDPDERFAGCLERRKRHDVVLDDHIRLLAGDDLADLRLAELRAVNERLPRRLHEGAELVDRRLPELWRRVADEVLPELTGVRGASARVGLRRRREVDEILDEAERLEPAGP